MKNNLRQMYEKAKEFVVQEGFSSEIAWQQEVLKKEIDESAFIREAAWVILASGFKEETIRKIFPKISFCFCDWGSSSEILEHKEQCVGCALEYFNNKGKIDAIAEIAKMINEVGFDSFITKIKKDPIEELKQLPYIGKITTYHLAKNIGFDIAKPDRHLVRIADSFQFGDVNIFCEKISKLSGDPVAVVDLVLWRYATLDPNYQYSLKKFSNISDNKLSFNQPNP